MSVIREMTVDALRDFKEYSRNEVIEIIEEKNDSPLVKAEKICVSTVLRTYPGIVKSTRGYGQVVFNLSRVQQHNVVLKTRLEVKTLK